MYVITGATGKTGRQLALELLRRKKPVRAIGRNAEILQELESRGAEPLAGDLEDSGLLARAVAGATAVFLLVPPNPVADDLRSYQTQIGDAEVAALSGARVKYVVFLSSLGADLDSGTGPVLGLHDQEERLRVLTGVHVLTLRPTYFMENLLGNIGIIRSQGVNGGAIEAHCPFPVIATRDIAAYAAERLVRLDFHGQPVQELLGPEDLTMAQMTAEIGRAIGKPDLQYVQFPYADSEKALVGMGFSSDVAHGFVELARAINERRGLGPVPRTKASTTPTRFRSFVEEVFAPAYEAHRPPPAAPRASASPPP